MASITTSTAIRKVIITNISHVTNISQDLQADYGQDGDGISSHFISVLKIIVSAAVCSGNTMTLIAIARNSRLRSVPNLYIGSLAVADFMVGLALFLGAVSRLSTDHYFVQYAESFCLAMISVLFISVAGSMFSYFLVACDRYMFIMHALRYTHLVTKRRSLSSILVVWSLASVYGTLPVYTSHFTRSGGCTPTHVFSRIYMLYVHPGMFLTVSGITFCLYVRIAKTALYQQRCIQNQNIFTEKPPFCALTKKTWRVTKLLFLVFGFFFFSWCPLFILTFMEYTVHINHAVLSIGCLVGVMNSGANCVVLAVMNRTFRSEFKRILCMFRSGFL